MNLKNTERRLLVALGLLVSANVALSQTVLYEEQFDGAGNGYNPDSTTAMLGDADWVDFGNGILPNFEGNEGYFTAVGGTESVLTGSSNSGDPQIRTDFAVGIPKANVGRIEIRARVDVDKNNAFESGDVLTAGAISLFWGTNAYVFPGGRPGQLECEHLPRRSR